MIKISESGTDLKVIDISEKSVVYREAIAEGYIELKPETIERIIKGEIEKGNVILTAKLAGILAAKKTSELIPLCHPINIEKIDIKVEVIDNKVKVTSIVSAHSKTGVEMEALTAVSIALLTIWDMVKKYEKDDTGNYPNTKITNIRVVLKQKKERE
ncbi:MAG: cyclic pyranopterin monophosphate synthase MoaC [Sulfolobaceae archaeon]